MIERTIMTRTMRMNVRICLKTARQIRRTTRLCLPHVQAIPQHARQSLGEKQQADNDMGKTLMHN
jgi:hypothetical protein